MSLVLEDRRVDVEVDHAVPGQGGRVHVDRADLAPLDATGEDGREPVGDLDLAGAQRVRPARGAGDQLEDDLLQVRLASPVVVEADHDRPARGDPLLELEWSGPRGWLRDPDLSGLEGAGRNDAQDADLADDQRERWLAASHVETDGVAVDRFHGRDYRREVAVASAGVVGVQDVVHRPDDVGGGHLLPVVELHALAEMVRPF